MAIKLKTMTYIDTDDVEELIGVNWSECEFAQMAENDSYVRLDCPRYFYKKVDLRKEM